MISTEPSDKVVQVNDDVCINDSSPATQEFEVSKSKCWIFCYSWSLWVVWVSLLCFCVVFCFYLPCLIS